MCRDGSPARASVIALLEALSYNLGVIASDIPANTEVPLSSDSFFKTGDVDALAEKIVAFLKSAIGRSYREIIEEYYNWDKIADQTMNVYKSIL